MDLLQDKEPLALYKESYIWLALPEENQVSINLINLSQVCCDIFKRILYLFNIFKFKRRTVGNFK